MGTRRGTGGRLRPVTESDVTSAAEERREVADRLLASHGAFVYRHGVGMLGEGSATEVFVSMFDYVHEHLAEPSEASTRGEGAHPTLHAMVYNRCIEHARSGGDRPVSDAWSGDERRVMEAFGRLKPVGRDALLRRLVEGARWSEQERTCGVPSKRMHMRVCRALRRMASLDGLPRVESGADAGESSSAESETGWQWSAIRRSAAEFVALRRTLRRVCDRWATPPDGWRAEVWAQLDERREEKRRAAEAARERTLDSSAAESLAPTESEGADSSASCTSSDLEDATPRYAESLAGSPEPQSTRRSARPMGWRLVRIVLVLGGLIALWFSVR